MGMIGVTGAMLFALGQAGHMHDEVCVCGRGGEDEGGGTEGEEGGEGGGEREEGRGGRGRREVQNKTDDQAQGKGSDRMFVSGAHLLQGV